MSRMFLVIFQVSTVYANLAILLLVPWLSLRGVWPFVLSLLAPLTDIPTGSIAVRQIWIFILGDHCYFEESAIGSSSHTLNQLDYSYSSSTVHDPGSSQHEKPAMLQKEQARKRPPLSRSYECRDSKNKRNRSRSEESDSEKIVAAIGRLQGIAPGCVAAELVHIFIMSFFTRGYGCSRRPWWTIAQELSSRATRNVTDAEIVL